jgi:hypothetical protein
MKAVLTVFGLPFLAVGIFMGYQAYQPWRQSQAMQAWAEVPARLIAVELQAHSGSEGGVTHRVAGDYTYAYGGREYRSNRISLYESSDNIGSFHERLYRRLHQAQTTGGTVPCYVNPQAPAEAVLERSLRTEMLLFQLGFTLVFGGVGLGLIIGGIVGAIRGRGAQRQKQANPGQPWLWKKEWAGGMIRSSTKAAALGTLLFAVLWNAIALPITWLAVPQLWASNRGMLLVVLIFPAVGVAVIGAAVYQILRWMKYGESVFQMAAVPGVIGGPLAGAVRVPVHVQPEEGFLVRLRCVNIVVTGSGKQQHTSEHVRWEAKRVMSRELFQHDPTQSGIPVLFGIPHTLSGSDDSAPRNRIVWRLEVEAKTSGVDYAATFEVPVFRTEASSPDFKLDESAIGPYEKTGAGNGTSGGTKQ